MSNYSNKTLELTRLALLIAMNCVSAYIVIPLPFSLSPIVLQTLVVNLVAFLLSPKQAFITMFVYILIGLVGIPVFTGGSAGPAKIFGPTGGYIWGYLVAAVLIAWLKGNKYNFKRYASIGVGLGIPVIYLFGCNSIEIINRYELGSSILNRSITFYSIRYCKVHCGCNISQTYRKNF